MHITGTHFNYYNICKRKLWLLSHQIQMEHTSDMVYEGKLIHETTYPQRSSRYEEIAIEGIKVDFYDSKKNIIHEIKKSDKKEGAHLWQLKYYLYIFEKNGIKNTSGIIEYPKLRKKEEIFLSEADRQIIKEHLKEITQIIHSEICPPAIQKSKCRNCSYFDFCYTNETSNNSENT